METEIFKRKKLYKQLLFLGIVIFAYAMLLVGIFYTKNANDISSINPDMMAISAIRELQK